jgi:hypothetical protein
VTVGDHQRDECTHRVTDHECRPTELIDDRGDVIGVPANPERWIGVEAAPAAAQVECDDLRTAREVVCHRIPRPRVRRDAVGGDERRCAEQTGPAQRAERDASDVELEELRPL